MTTRDVRRPRPQARRGTRRQPPYVYRRRRLVVLLAALAVVAGLVATAETGLRRLPLGGPGATVDTADGGPGGAAEGMADGATDGRPATRRPEATHRPEVPRQQKATRPTPRAGSGPPAVPTTAREGSGGQPAPTPVAVPRSGTGKLSVVPVELPANTRSGRPVRYAVEVEGGLPFEPVEFARSVHAILGHALGWQRVEDVAFELTRGKDRDLTVTLASPRMTDRLCAPLRTLGEVSCWNGSHAVINAKRWGRGAPTYGEDITNYRRYLVAHEVGHGLGKRHVNCPRIDAPAPVMVQQTKSLQGCRPNPYPATG